MVITRPLASYILIYGTLLALQPPGLFDPDGRPRAFGVLPGQTLVPAWLFSLAVTLLTT